MSTLYQLSSIWSALLAIGVVLGSAFVVLGFGRGQKIQFAKMQQETVDLLESQIKAVQQELENVKKENLRLSNVIETITAALLQKGMILSITGDLVTISDAQGVSSSYRRHHRTPAKPTTAHEEQ